MSSDATRTDTASPQTTLRPPQPTQTSLNIPERTRAHLRPTASIARSISWGFAWRKLMRWLVIDLSIALLLTLIFYWHCTQSLSPAALDGITTSTPAGPLLLPEVCSLTNTANGIAPAALQVAGADGITYRFELQPYLMVCAPLLIWLVVCQVSDFLHFVSDTRRVRRKLQPLNDLAVAAEAMGQVAAATDPMTQEDKMATLEQAIERATVDSPTVATGDTDLRSIEVALNGLLRQMQEAKLQQMRFVSDASHELRTPIAVIQGYVNMLDRWGKTDEGVLEESIEALKAESDHMQELVEQLLFLARGDSGRNTLNHMPVDLAQVVQEVWDESCMIDDHHEYACTTSEADSSGLMCVGDLAMLKQSLRIIVQNAEKYSPEGSTITLCAKREGPMVCYQVQDEGIGMSEHDVRHIFDRFYRADGALNGEADGSGLGLSIAKWIVDAHEGKIEVVSREGVGTRFTVKLPASDGTS